MFIAFKEQVNLGIKDKRKNIQLGDSIAITLPSKLTVGQYSTLAGDRLLLIDPRGEISEDDLLDFMEKHIEPNCWIWHSTLRDWGLSTTEKQCIETVSGFWHMIMMTKVFEYLQGIGVTNIQIQKRIKLGEKHRFSPDIMFQQDNKRINIEIGVPSSRFYEFLKQNPDVYSLILLRDEESSKHPLLKNVLKDFGQRVVLLQYTDFKGFADVLNKLLTSKF